jgi:hypothetical protein
LLERKHRLGQTERALEQEAAQRAAAQASLQAREETLSAARDQLAQLQAELQASEHQRLELEAALDAQLERAHTPLQDSLLEADVGGEREGSSLQARPERARPVPPKPNQEQRRAAAGAAGTAERPPADRPASEPRMTPPRAAARWRVKRRQGDQMLHTSYGDLLQLSISGERTAQLMQRLQRAAPQLQLLADALYPPS